MMQKLIALFLVFWHVQAMSNLENKFSQLKKAFSYGKTTNDVIISSDSTASDWASIQYSTDLKCNPDGVYEVLGVVSNFCLPSSLSLDPAVYPKLSAYYSCKNGM